MLHKGCTSLQSQEQWARAPFPCVLTSIYCAELSQLGWGGISLFLVSNKSPFCFLLIMISTVLIYIPRNSVWVPLSPHPPQYLLFHSSHSNCHKVIPHCNFDLHFSDAYTRWPFVHVAAGGLYFFFWEISLQTFVPFLTRWVPGGGVEGSLVPYIFWILILYLLRNLTNIFFPFYRLSFRSVDYLICWTETSLISITFVYFCFCTFRVSFKNVLSILMSWIVFPMFSSSSFILSDFIF